MIDHLLVHRSIMRAIARIQMRNDAVPRALTPCPNLRVVNNFAKGTAAPPAARLRIFRDLIIFCEYSAQMRNDSNLRRKRPKARKSITSARSKSA
jgi:hypothetical protein